MSCPSSNHLKSNEHVTVLSEVFLLSRVTSKSEARGGNVQWLGHNQWNTNQFSLLSRLSQHQSRTVQDGMRIAD